MSKERPIIFSGDMVRAILAGRKTQTRRVVKDQNAVEFSEETREPLYVHSINCPGYCDYACNGGGYGDSPYGVPGDRLWVREKIGIQLTPNDKYPNGLVEYGADYHDGVDFIYEGGGSAWTPSIFMPRWASRITLEITGVRVERVQEITYLDAIAEGVDRDYHLLWDRINAKRGYPWSANPWVWVVEFKRV